MKLQTVDNDSSLRYKESYIGRLVAFLGLFAIVNCAAVTNVTTLDLRN
jgi:hypothetical protein